MGLLRHSKLFRKAFLSLALGLLLWFPLFYLLTVPAIERMAYTSEEAASRNLVNSVLEVVKRASVDLDRWRQVNLDSHREQLRSVLSLVESYAAQLERDVAGGRLNRRQARENLLQWLRTLRYADEGYVWASDYQSVLVSHPDAKFDGMDASAVRDVRGQLVIPPMVEEARANGAGYTSYWWPRLERGRAEEKLSYFRDLPAWGLVIGTGLYLDDFEAEMARRKAELTTDLRAYLHSVRLAGSGYVFVIDASENVVVHPDAAVEGRSMRDFKDGASGQALGPLLIQAAKSDSHQAVYHWNRPEDPGNYSYRKLAWVYPVPQFDWYLGASVYADDLGRSGDYLRRQLIGAFLVGLLITAAGSFVFIRRLTAPILQLAEIARRQAAGDLAARSEIRRNDEIGVLAEAFNRMVSALQAQMAELRASENKIRALFEQSLAGMFLIQDGRFRYVNAALARMHGYDSPQEIIDGVAVADLLQAEERDQLLASMARVQAGAEPGGERVFGCRCKDGRRIEVCCSLAPIDYAEGRGLIGIVLDVTESRRAEMARVQALAAAEQLSRLKSQFIANMSHELLTPLHGVIGLACVGERVRDLQKAQSYFGHIRVAGEGLQALVGNVLDFSRLADGSLALTESNVDLKALLDEVALRWRGRAEAKGLAFELQRLPGLPAHGRCDQARLLQILDCLLDNALKFTEAGEIRLLAGGDEQRLEITVADTGIGIAGERLPELFRPFEQLDGGSDRLHGGMGLGLALAQQLASLMGGSIAVASELGGGTRFQLQLPLRAAAEVADASADYSI